MSASRTSRTRKRDWKPAFLTAFEETGMVNRACEAAGIGRTTAYEARQKDETFALAWADVDERVTETMEREMYRRAVEGVEKPVFQGGQRVGTIREYSDTLLIFGLKARRPDKYRDNVKVEHSGSVKTEPPVIPNDAERQRQVAELLAAAGALDGADD